MYFPGPSDRITALDAASGDVLWIHQRELPKDMGQFLTFPDTNRNLGDLRQPDHRPRIGRPYLRGRCADREARVGNQILDYKKGAKQSPGPIIAEGLAITGRSCEPEGGPDACVITAA